MYSVQCTLYIIQRIIHNVRFTIYDILHPSNSINVFISNCNGSIHFTMDSIFTGIVKITCYGSRGDDNNGKSYPGYSENLHLQEKYTMPKANAVFTVQCTE